MPYYKRDPKRDLFLTITPQCGSLKHGCGLGSGFSVSCWVHSLNSLKGWVIWGTIIGCIKGDTRSLDSGSFGYMKPRGLQTECVGFGFLA